MYNLFASNIHLEGYLKYTKENVENKTRKGFNKNKCEHVKITIVFLNIVICFIALNFIFNYNICDADTCYHKKIKKKNIEFSLKKNNNLI